METNPSSTSPVGLAPEIYFVARIHPSCCVRALALHQDSREELVEAFRAIDRNRDGTIDAEVLQSLMVATGFGLADLNVGDVFSEVDKDGSGKVDLEEFVTYMMGT